MKILYLSRLASKAAISEDPDFVGNAVQKFNRLIAEGIVRNGHDVIALSTFFMKVKGFAYKRKCEEENGVNYCYMFSPNNSILRSLWLIVCGFFKVFLWGINDKNNKVLIADVLNVSACMGAVAAARIVGLRRVGIVTDLPGQMVDGNNKNTKVLSLKNSLNNSFLKHFSHYILLTEQMNSVVNKKKRPYLVMEGLVDKDMLVPETISKAEKRIVLYAGGLHEQYGLKLLVEGFMQANLPGTELWIYGNGPFAELLPNYSKEDNRIVFKGSRPNSEVVDAELNATLLVNPRPTHEEFTKYSFPSKNMEYMVSGTPVLTTMLPGMPKEYYPYVYLFDKGETVDGYAEVMRNVLLRNSDELRMKGMQAREWVLVNKNHVQQTKRIVELIKQ